MISIAVCDDNEITAQEISEKVKQCCPIEAEVSVFYHIKDILFSIHNENKLFDIIFMDIEFDVSSGIEASKQINAWHPDCQIIYITNYTNYFTSVYETSHIYYILKKDIVPSCDDPVVQGLEQEGVIMNRADVDFAATVFNSTKKNVIETLAMKTGKKAYKVVVPGKNPFTGTKTSLVAGTYRSSFTNTVAIVILANDPDVCADVIDGLANCTYVVVLENKYKGLQKEGNPGDAAFQVYGYYQGLTATAIDNDKYSEDTEGGWAVTLEEQKTPKSALFLFKTSYEATKTAVNTLTAEPAA